jgi:hypothetical protein
VKRSFIRSLVLFAVLAVLVAVGFVVLDRGGQQSDASSVSEVVKSYDAALADGEGDAACSLLTAEAAQRVARQHGYGGTLRIDATRTRATCPDGIENRYLGEDAYFEELKFAPISDVEVRGQDAPSNDRPRRLLGDRRPPQDRDGLALVGPAAALIA